MDYGKFTIILTSMIDFLYAPLQIGRPAPDLMAVLRPSRTAITRAHDRHVEEAPEDHHQRPNELVQTRWGCLKAFETLVDTGRFELPTPHTPSS